MLAQDVFMWVLQVHWLVGLIVWLIIVGVLLVAAWTGMRIWRHRARVKYAEAARAAKRAGPPTGRGVCNACGTFHEEVRYLPDGRKLCRTCYEVETGVPDR